MGMFMGGTINRFQTRAKEKKDFNTLKDPAMLGSISVDTKGKSNRCILIENGIETAAGALCRWYM